MSKRNVLLWSTGIGFIISFIIIFFKVLMVEIVSKTPTYALLWFIIPLLLISEFIFILCTIDFERDTDKRFFNDELAEKFLEGKFSSFMSVKTFSIYIGALITTILSGILLAFIQFTKDMFIVLLIGVIVVAIIFGISYLNKKLYEWYNIENVNTTASVEVN